jgi:hypothetical protein
MYKNHILKKTLNLKEADITYHTKIYVIMEDLDDGTGYRAPIPEKKSASPPREQLIEPINTSATL